METFAPGDRVVAINTDLSAPICRMESLPDAYSFPDGPLNEKTVYHVEKVRSAADGHQGLFITGIRVFVGKYHVPWDKSQVGGGWTSGTLHHGNQGLCWKIPRALG